MGVAEVDVVGDLFVRVLVRWMGRSAWRLFVVVVHLWCGQRIELSPSSEVIWVLTK